MIERERERRGSGLPSWEKMGSLPPWKRKPQRCERWRREADRRRWERRVRAYGEDHAGPPFRDRIDQSGAAQRERGGAVEMPPLLAREFADWACGQLYGEPRGWEDRAVYIQPFPGHYGTCGYVVTIQGSPEKATMLFVAEWCEAPNMLLMGPSGAPKCEGKPGPCGDCGKHAERYRIAAEFIERAGLPARRDSEQR